MGGADEIDLGEGAQGAEVVGQVCVAEGGDVEAIVVHVAERWAGGGCGLANIFWGGGC